MKNSDRIKRAIAFYSSCLLYLVLLPIVLSYSLGYKIDYRDLKVYKTGILYIASNPAGASIYINGKELGLLTPAQIEELKPGTYRVEVKRDGFYSWEKDLVVRPNMVTRAGKIILFPITHERTRISEREVSDFLISDKNLIYYMTPSGLYRSNIDGTGLKRLSAHSDWPQGIMGKRFSREGDKFLFFNERTVWVVYLTPDNARVEECLSSDDPILDVFWYSGSGYIIAVTDKYINAAELRRGGMLNAVWLYKFTSRPRRLYYDSGSDSIYFTDIERGAEGRQTNHLYRLDLRQTFLDKLMKLLLRREQEIST